MNQDTPQVVTEAPTETEAPVVAETPEVAAPEEAEKPVEKKPDPEKGLARLERRLGKRTAELYQERAAREQLEQRLRQYESQQQPQEEGESPRLDPQKVAEYVRYQAQEIARLERVNEKCNTIAEEGTKSFPGFENSVRTIASELGALFDNAGRPTATMEVLLEAEKPAALIHHLGSNPEILEQLEGLNPIQLARRIAKIESEMTSKTTTSKAPTPLKPAKPQASSGELDSNLSIQEWMRRREAQIKERRGY